MKKKYRIRLIKRDNEPVYLPVDDEIPFYRIVFSETFILGIILIFDI
ncbi:MAG: elongation factor P hydroxylase [Arsenophonus sp. NC-WZS1-MAG3]